MKKQWIPYTCKVCGKDGFTCLSLPRKTCSRECANKSFENSDEDFFRFVKKTDSCWLWTGAISLSGYGFFFQKSKRIFAHRYSFKLHNGVIPFGLCVLHDCPDGDNPRCVNPKHLWLGTRSQNSKDRDNKLRTCCGENHYSAKLAAVNVTEIRRSNHLTLETLARRFGVSIPTIHAVRSGKSWKQTV